MKTFKQFLEESLIRRKVHHDNSISNLKGVAVNAVAAPPNDDNWRNAGGRATGVARFVIDMHHNLHYGDANHFIHDDLSKDQPGVSVSGYVKHRNGKFTYHAVEGQDAWDDDELADPNKHPMLKRFEANGIKRVRMKPF